MSTSPRTNAGVSHSPESPHTSVRNDMRPEGLTIRNYHRNGIGGLYTNPSHDNPVQYEQVSDAARAALFCEFDRVIASVAPDRMYMPTMDDSKAPIISGMGEGALETDKAREMLHEPHEAAKAIRNGKYGFLLYAGRTDHGTTDLCFVDFDDLDTVDLDDTPQSLTVMSGSGGFHRTYVNDGSVENASPACGEVRANNWYVVVPGSRHEDGGVYHIYREHPIVDLSHDQLPDELHPSSGGNDDSRQHRKGNHQTSTSPDSNGGTGFSNSNGCSSTTGTSTEISNSDIDLTDHSELDADTVNQYENSRGKTLEYCRGEDDYLDTLLSEKHLPNLTDKSRIEEKLVSRCRYHWFNRQQQADILRCFRQRFRTEKPEKLDRHNYVIPTIEAFSDCLRRAVYDDSFGSHIVYRSPTDNSDGHEHIDKDEARDRCQATINEAMDNGHEVLIDAVPSLGKSSGTVRAANQTDTPVTILTARHDLYTQYNRWADKHDLSIQNLPSFPRDCGCMAGDHGDAWQERMHQLYSANVSPSLIHAKATDEFGEQPPCCDDGPCGYTDKYEFEPSEYDLIVGHYTHAYNTNMTADRMVVFDEFVGESFIEEFDANETAAIVSNWLDQFDDAPVETVDDIKRVNTNQSITGEFEHVNNWLIDNAIIGHETVSIGSHSDQHMLAPVLVNGLLTAGDLNNGWEHSTVQCDNELGHVTVIDDFEFVRNRESQTVYVLNQPDLSKANGIIALDGTPAIDMWETAVGVSLDREPILDDSERRAYIRDVLDMEIVPLTDSAAYPCSGGYNNNQYQNREQAMIRAIDRMHDEQPSLITSNSVLQSYDDTISEYIDESMHYGNLVSSNAFETKPLGIVSGSPHYGDGFCKLWSALNGEPTDRVEINGDETNGMETEYTNDIGDAALEHMRESQVTQAILRFGRHESVDASTVYVNTAAYHDWLPTTDCGDVVTASDRRKDVITALVNGTDSETDHEYMTYEDITDKDYLSVSESSIKRTLNELEDYEYVESQRPLGKSPRFTPTDRLHEFVM